MKPHRKLIKKVFTGTKFIDDMPSVFFFILSTTFHIRPAKVILKAKNYVMNNYNFKIWKFAKDLKLKM